MRVMHRIPIYVDLLVNLALRDIRVRYKQSLLGIGWAILLPLSLMLVFTFVFTHALSAKSALGIDMPYALYAYCGLVPWTLLSMSLSGCVNSLVANRNLVTKVYFPREVFPLSCVLSSLVDFLVAMSVLAGLMVYFHCKGTWVITISPAILFLPVVLAVELILIVGLGLTLAMANLFYRDVRQIFAVAIQLWMFVSAVVVPVPRDGSWVSQMIQLNPMIYLIQAYRDCLLLGQFPEWWGFGYAATIALGSFVLSGCLFRRASYRFAECI